VNSLRRTSIPAIVADGCLLTTQSITLIAGLLGNTLVLLVTALALLSVVSNQRHRRQSATHVLTLIIGSLRSRDDLAPGQDASPKLAPPRTRLCLRLRNGCGTPVRRGNRSSGGAVRADTIQHNCDPAQPCPSRRNLT
jgi:hypothetical protein